MIHAMIQNCIRKRSWLKLKKDDFARNGEIKKLTKFVINMKTC